MEMAEPVAKLMAAELEYDEVWQRQQVEDFYQVAQGFVVG